MRRQGLKTILSRQFYIRFNPLLARRINLLFELYFEAYDETHHHQPGYERSSQIETSGLVS
jgi:hypothetical protein